MWIVKLALRRPYTFIVLAIVITLFGVFAIWRTPTDIFPNIRIPVVATVWKYTGLSPEEMATRLILNGERTAQTTVNDVEHTESQSVSGTSVVKYFFQPNVNEELSYAQITGVSQTMLRFAPPGTTAPFVLAYNASSVPVLQLALSSPSLSEAQLFDQGNSIIRTALSTVAGASMPWPYGGLQRQVQVDLDPDALRAPGLSDNDVTAAFSVQNSILPAGTEKIGDREYFVSVNANPKTVAELNDLPVATRNGSVIYVRDVAHVRDGYPPQTNIVRRDGHRGVLMSVLKTGSASTLDIIRGIKERMPRIRDALPPDFKIDLVGDQSIFVRAAISGVVREAVIAASLTALMILLFLGTWRSTLIIAISIPLSILASIICLSALGETINIMTLGGLALAVGILVDDATVTIENINWHLERGEDVEAAILNGAHEIAVPAFVSTLAICIVFVPMFLLAGIARYLFVPLAEAVVFAMLASYLLSRTLVPTIARYLLSPPVEGAAPPRNLLARGQQTFERGFERIRLAYRELLTRLIDRRAVFIPVFLAACLAAFLLIPRLGENFFPDTDSGQFTLHLRAQTGTRIEETARLTDLVEEAIRRVIPAAETDVILDNIGLPSSAINWMHGASGVIGAADADILVSLKPDHRPTADHVRALRQTLPTEFPGVTFYFLPADIVTQIINFGLPAPIDIQLEGADVQGNRRVADQMLNELRRVPGLVDLRIQQRFDYPKFDVTVDRTKAGQGGFTTRDLASSLLVSLSGSFQTTPTFFLNWQNGVNYNLATQTPQYRIQSLQDLQNIPISSPTTTRPGILADVASITRSSEIAVLSHYNIRRVVDIHGAVQDRDLGAVR